MDKSLKFWNEEKFQRDIFNNNTQGKVSWAVCPSKGGNEIRACAFHRNQYRILSIREKEGIKDDGNNYNFRPPENTEHVLVQVQAVEWNPKNHDQIAVGLSSGNVVQWNIATNKLIHHYQAERSGSYNRPRSITCVQWLPEDPNLLVCGSMNPFFFVWDVRQREHAQIITTNDKVHDIKVNPFDENLISVACDNHEVYIYELRQVGSDKLRNDRPTKPKFKFSAHDQKTMRCEWNPKERNLLATCGQKNIKIWKLDYSIDYSDFKERLLIKTRNQSHIKWSPHCEDMLASHTHSSSYVEIWNINQRFRPYRLFKTNGSAKTLYLHWHDQPNALLTLNRFTSDVTMHARRDAVNTDYWAPSCAIACSPYDEISFVTPVQRMASRPISAAHEHAGTEKSCIYTKRLREGGHSRKFIHLANNYRLSPENFEETCQHNAEVAESQGLLHVASNWRLLSVLYTEQVILPFYDGEVNFENQRKLKRSNTQSADRGNVVSSDQSLESPNHESDSDHIDYFSRTGYGESELAPIRKVEEEDEEEEGEMFSESQPVHYQWEMLDEPFTQQTLHTESTEYDEGSDRSSLPDTDPAFYSYDATQENPSSFRHNRGGTENIKININYKIESLTIDMLEDLVEEGDVQSACTMILVLDRRLDRETLEEGEFDITVPWFYAYLDLLSRFKLWNVQAEIVGRSTNAVQLLNSTSEIKTICGKPTCKRVLRRGICSACGPVAVCSVCRLAVRGVYMWCQGCCHGGHLDHIQDWFAKYRDCPAACGHQCEWS